jgi:hypothetical protein
MIRDYPYRVIHIFRRNNDIFVGLNTEYDEFLLIQIPHRYHNGFRNLCLFLREQNVENFRLENIGDTNGGEPILHAYGREFFMYVY